MKPYNNAIIERAHDVRTLRPCHYCGGIGNADSMIEFDDNTWHGRCFIEKKGLESFMQLPREQTNRLRLDDIGTDVMRKLIDRFPQVGGWVR